MYIFEILGRLLFGGFFFYSGLKHFSELSGMQAYTKSKGVPSSKFIITLTGLLIILGGLGVALNFHPQESATLIAIFLLLITPQMHAYWKETDPMKKMAEKVNFWKNIALLGASLIIAF